MADQPHSAEGAKVDCLNLRAVEKTEAEVAAHDLLYADSRTPAVQTTRFTIQNQGSGQFALNFQEGSPLNFQDGNFQLTARAARVDLPTGAYATKVVVAQGDKVENQREVEGQQTRDQFSQSETLKNGSGAMEMTETLQKKGPGDSTLTEVKGADGKVVAYMRESWTTGANGRIHEDREYFSPEGDHTQRLGKVEMDLKNTADGVEETITTIREKS